MTTLLSELIQLNIELEGALRVAQSRPEAPEALALAKEKFAQLSKRFAELNESVEEETEAPVSAPIVEETPQEKVAEEVKTVEEVAETAVVSNIPREANSLIKTFTINDKFLFRRELFDGSEADFVDTLNLLEAMSSLDEASEYLFCDLGWDSENEIVADFMNILTNYFKND